MVRLALHSIAYEAKTLNLAKEGYTAFYVDGTNGSNVHDGGSWGQAFETIQHAVDEAESWATIFIRAGTYVESVNIPTTKDSISLIGDHPTGTIIRPSSSYAIYIQGESCAVSNLTAIGAEVGLGAGLYIDGDYVDVKNCVVGNSVAVPLAGKGLYCNSKYGKINNVSLHQVDLAKYGIHIDDDNIEVSNCYLENAFTYAILFGSGCNWAKVFENTIVNAGTHGIYCSGSSYNVAYHNNLVASSIHDAIGGTAHRLFENYYSTHTNVDNGFGIAKSPYTYTGGSDPRPVITRNGWNGLSLADVFAETPILFQKATKSITLSSAATPVTQILFYVTGEVECYLVGYIDTGVTSGGALTLEAGNSSDNSGLIATTAKGNLAVGNIWVDATAGRLRPKPQEVVISNGDSIAHYINVASATGGAITYYCWWRPLSSNGNVVAT